MKKKMGIILSMLLFTGTLVGCTTETSTKTPETKHTQTNQGITVNKVPYITLSKEDSVVPKDLRKMIKQHEKKRGFITYRQDEGLYIYIASGEKNTGGYDINIHSVEDNEGKTNVYVKETEPKQDMMVTQAFTYPYVLIKATRATDNVHVYNLIGNGKISSLEAIE